jgi:hypothetical protein
MISVTVFLSLGIGIIIVLWRRRWIPIRARGAASLIASYIGGIIWLMSALATVYAEDFDYDSAQPEPAGWWGSWSVFVCGFGLWMTSNVVHLRAMVKIHIFHEIPMAFFPHWCMIGLLPWILLSIGASIDLFGQLTEFIGMIMCVWSILYVLLHLTQVWQLREDLDVVESAVTTILGAVVMIWGRSRTFGLDPLGSGLDPDEALLWPIIVGCVVLLHFSAGSVRLLYLALFDHKNLAILESYHNDYHAGGKHDGQMGTFRESMVSFDTAVENERQSIPKTEMLSRNNSFSNRIARTKFGAAAGHVAGAPLRASGHALKKIFGPASGSGSGLLPRSNSLASFRESFTRAKATTAGVQMSYVLILHCILISST